MKTCLGQRSLELSRTRTNESENLSRGLDYSPKPTCKFVLVKTSYNMDVGCHRHPIVPILPILVATKLLYFTQIMKYCI